MNKKESEENIWEIIGFIKVSSSRYKTIKSLSGNDYKMPSEIAKEKIKARLDIMGEEKAQFLILHPPYDDIIKFSDKKEDLSKIVRDIKNVGGNIAGVVYNKKPVSNKKKNETYYYASVPMKIDSKKRQQEMEYEQKRQVQRNRATDMLNRDRNPEEYQKEEAKKVEIDDRPPEEKAAEMLKQFNDYLQKEKENRDNNRS